MNHVRKSGLMMAMAACLVLAPAVASATEGPFYKTEGSRLGASETRLLLVTAKENFVLEAAALGETIVCAKLSLPIAGHMQIQGSSAGNAGTGNGVADFTQCTQTGNGEACEVANQLVASEPIIDLLSYSTATRGGPVLVLFEPASGTVFATVKYAGAGCKVPSLAITGTVVALVQAGGTQVQVGSGTESLHGEVKFHKNNRTAFVEKGGVVGASIKGQLQFGGVAAQLVGTALLLVHLVLPSGELRQINWGIFS